MKNGIFALIFAVAFCAGFASPVGAVAHTITGETTQKQVGNRQIEIGIITPVENNMRLLAILRDDQKCGWCSNASKDSPVARSMSGMLSLGIIPSDCWQSESDIRKDYYILEMT
jgi:hypothetical protein